MISCNKQNTNADIFALVDPLIENSYLISLLHNESWDLKV